ncbi:MAG: hypothetical protein JXB03_06845 [Spirochaetales bacterium]|nr:hypothetical protein [Spirochaetales bacterium]
MKSRLYIFHIEHPSGEPILLHPFLTDDDILSKLPHADVQGVYGRDPRVETITLIRTVLYRKIESAVQNWLKEKRFLRKFLVSSVVFLAVYLGMSVFMRDPLPMIDELLIALAASVGLYVYLAKKEQNSEPAVRKRVQLRGKLDAVHFSRHAAVDSIEVFIKEHSQKTRDEILEYIASGEGIQNGDNDEVACALTEYARRQLAGRKLKRR